MAPVGSECLVPNGGTQMHIEPLDQKQKSHINRNMVGFTYSGVRVGPFVAKNKQICFASKNAK